MGKWASEHLAILFLKDKKTPDDRIFFHVGTLLTKLLEKKEISKKAPRGTKKKINNISKKSFSQKLLHIIWQFISLHFLSWSNFNSLANFSSLMTSDGALESSHQREFVFCHLAGGRNKCKKIIICWGQTDSSDIWHGDIPLLPTTHPPPLFSPSLLSKKHPSPINEQGYALWRGNYLVKSTCL